MNCVKTRFFETLCCVLIFMGGAHHMQAQTITGISGTGVKNGTTAGTYVMDYVDINASSASSHIAKEFVLSLSGITGGTKLVFSASTTSGWEFQQGSRSSNAWKSFCYDNISLSSGTTSETFCIRTTNTSPGTYTNTITIGFGTCSAITGSYTMNVTATVTSGGVYYWEAGAASGGDSSYNTAGNWYPSRSTKASTDVLVVDLGTGSTRKASTIDMSGVNDSVSQFLVKTLNLVNFKNTTNGTFIVGESTSKSGDDFFVDTLSIIRKTGSSNLTIRAKSGNMVNVDGQVHVVAGNLNFNGPATHMFAGNINMVGGTLDFSPLSGSRTLYLNGKAQTLSGTGGTLTFGNNTPITTGSSRRCTLTLSRPVYIYNVLTLRDSSVITSTGGPGSSPTAAQWNSWVPNLQFKANSSGYGKLATVPSTSTVTGDCLFEIYCNTTRSWRSFGIPLKNGVNLSQFSDNIDITGSKSGNNLDSFSTCSNCKSSAYRWVESSQGWSAIASSSTATNIALGKGAYIFYRGTRSNGLGDSTVSANNQTIDFKGQLNVGSTTVNLDYNGSSASTTLRGYNLVGNPYPCAVDLKNVFSNSTNIKKRAVVYDAIAKTYNVWDSTGSSLSRSGSSNFTSGSQNRSRIVEAGAAVFLIATGSGASASFSESDKTTTQSSVTGHFKETPKALACNTLNLRLQYVNDTHPESDNAIMVWNETASDVSEKLDGYDVEKFYAGYLGVGTVANDGKWMSIDKRGALPWVNHTYTTEVKVAVPEASEYKLSWQGCAAASQQYKVYLIDKALQKMVPLSAQQPYVFTADKSVSNTARFAIQMEEIAIAEIENGTETGLGGTQQEEALGSKTITRSGFALFPNPSADGKFQVAVSEGEQLLGWRVMNALGQVVAEHQGPSTNPSIELPAHCNKGSYWIELIGIHNSKTIRVQFQ
jgi:hypothetical protein